MKNLLVWAGWAEDSRLNANVDRLRHCGKAEHYPVSGSFCLPLAAAKNSADDPLRPTPI